MTDLKNNFSNSSANFDKNLAAFNGQILGSAGSAVRANALTDILNKFFSDAQRDFPKLNGSFMVIDGNSGEAIGDIASGKLNTSAQDLAVRIAQRNRGTYTNTQLLDPSVSDYGVNSGEIYAIDYHKPLAISGNTERDIKFSLNYALAEAVVPNAINPADINYDSTSGDIFALLKDEQEYGDANNDFLTLLARQRSQSALLGDTLHFTNAALDAYAAAKNSLDIKSMTPGQLTAFAAKLAGENKLTAQQTYNLAAFSKIGAQYARSTGNNLGAFLHGILKDLLSQNYDKSTFETGYEIVKPFMKDVPGAPSPLPLKDPKWPEVVKQLQEKLNAVEGHPAQQTAQSEPLQKEFKHLEPVKPAKAAAPKKTL